ncbi:MAG: hypothetical protein JNJ73_15895 [Hyphomonadaceae bacterium]|nr:hypothetical protein [Hyphomonadaceae bacterium]
MKIQVRFKNDNGNEVVATFDRDAGTVSTQDGQKGTYSRPEGSRTMEIKGDVNLTMTFADDVRFEQGYSTRYTTNDGRAGVATILSVG